MIELNYNQNPPVVSLRIRYGSYTHFASVKLINNGNLSWFICKGILEV